MRIITDGPSMIPPMTSAMTLGCRILDKGQCSIRQKIIIIIAYATGQHVLISRTRKHGKEVQNLVVWQNVTIEKSDSSGTYSPAGGYE